MFCCISIHELIFLFLLMIPLSPLSTLFPYTTLFRSQVSDAVEPINQAIDDLAGFGPLRSGRGGRDVTDLPRLLDRKSTRLNSSHRTISYAVFCLKKKK